MPPLAFCTTTAESLDLRLRTYGSQAAQRRIDKGQNARGRTLPIMLTATPVVTAFSAEIQANERSYDHDDFLSGALSGVSIKSALPERRLQTVWAEADLSCKNQCSGM